MAKYQRKIFLVNPNYQLKFCLAMCSFLLIGTAIFPLSVYDLFEKIITAQPYRAAEIKDQRFMMMSIVILIQLLIVSILFIFTVFLTHKTAGPIYKVISYFRDVRDGNGFKQIYFRDGDHFPELAEEVNLLSEYLGEKVNADLVYLSEVKSYISNLTLVVPDDKKAVLAEIIKKLDLIQSQYKA